MSEISFFKSHPLPMKVLLLTNLIYALVLPIIELFIGAYIMRNSNDISLVAVSYTHLRAHETVLDIVCRLLLEKKKKQKIKTHYFSRYAQ